MPPRSGHLDQAGTTHQLCQMLRLDRSLELRTQHPGSCGVALNRCGTAGKARLQSEENRRKAEMRGLGGEAE